MEGMKIIALIRTLDKIPEYCDDCPFMDSGSKRAPAICQLSWNAISYSGGDGRIRGPIVRPNDCWLLDAEEIEKVRHGRWEETNGETICTACHCIGDPLKMFGRIMWKYCPMCGAKMDVDAVRDETRNEVRK